ncbi:MAG: chitobiase/beta-hexosaminidase C-terminal domain-containing protein, partial [Chitinivibrionales bacterium]
MKWAMLAFLILLMCLTGQAQTDTVPEWLDTIPPVVHVLPDKRFQNEMFHITLGINEPGRLYMGFTAEDSLKPYTKPYTILTPGSYTVYYYAEDDMGNRSALDSATYVFDKTPPVLTVDPKQGMFRHEVLLEVRANEPCDFFMHTDKKPIDINHTPGTGSGTGRNANGEQHHLVKVDTFRISENFEGYISARDASGNIRTQGPFTYIIDTTDFSVAIDPKPGVYNDPDVSVRFIAPPQLSVFYSFDPTAPPKWFTKYDGAVDLPHGVSLLRYFWVNSYGQESDIEKATFVVDTVAPRIRFQHIRGKTVDSLLLLSSEPAQIRYSRQPKAPLGSEQTYQGPIAIDRRIRGYVKAMARDSAGNMSELFVWQHRYDTLPPRVWPLRKSGKYNSPFALRFGMSESVKVFYTLNGSAPDRQSALYQDSIQISRNGLTVVKFFAVDLAGNSSEPDSCYYYLDLTPPVVKARVEGNLRKNLFHVTLRPSEPSTIYYEIGGSEPTIRSPRYSKPIAVRQGQTLIYFAQDSAGNNSEMYRLDELKSPMVKISPEGGVFNRRINITFETNGPSRIYYRIPPDTVYRICHDSLLLQQEGLQTVEYYSENRQGIKSTVRRNEYLIDWTAPRVNISMRKGTDDSVYVFFESNESATIYYTLDGSSPLFSSSTRVAGNKFLMSGDRISVKRNAETKLAFYAEDIAGNQSMLSVIDVAKPRVIPNLPAGSDKVYDRILSVRLNTYDQNSQIYYERHGKSPTMDSPLYSSPITLMRSDTIIAFVMD